MDQRPTREQITKSMESVPEICQFPFPVLLEPCKEVTVFDASLSSLIDLMFITMYFDHGIGLAANQIYQSVSVAVMHVPGWNRMTLVNPKIVRAKGEETNPEGCLSIDHGHLRLPIIRASKIWVEYQDKEGAKCSMKANGLLARCIQHECDHLNGLVCLHRKDGALPWKV